MIPDGNNLAHIQIVVIQLSNKDGSHCLIERRAIHVDGGAHWEHKAGNPLVNAIVLFSTPECDRQRGGAERHRQSGLSEAWVHGGVSEIKMFTDLEEIMSAVTRAWAMPSVKL